MKKIALVLGLMATFTAYAGIAFFKYEIAGDGLTKVCVYDHIGNLHSITIKSYQNCPISIQVN